VRFADDDDDDNDNDDDYDVDEDAWTAATKASINHIYVRLQVPQLMMEINLRLPRRTTMLTFSCQLPAAAKKNTKKKHKISKNIIQKKKENCKQLVVWSWG